MCKTLLCFSQNFLNIKFENDKHAGVDMYQHPDGGYPIVVTHIVPETQLQEMQNNLPDIKILGVVKDGEKPHFSRRTDTEFYYRPLPEWKKRLSLSA